MARQLQFRSMALQVGCIRERGLLKVLFQKLSPVWGFLPSGLIGESSTGRCFSRLNVILPNRQHGSPKC